jgi:hypothetical protein
MFGSGAAPHSGAVGEDSFSSGALLPDESGQLCCQSSNSVTGINDSNPR